MRLATLPPPAWRRLAMWALIALCMAGLVKHIFEPTVSVLSQVTGLNGCSAAWAQDVTTTVDLPAQLQEHTSVCQDPSAATCYMVPRQFTYTMTPTPPSSTCGPSACDACLATSPATCALECSSYALRLVALHASNSANAISFTANVVRLLQQGLQ
ncbi:hypothetical protein COO60DRAFT_1462281 [Scenedesmus sp. NREL 46B-D3]|nr:hypothetical protein COO60DRAFT_1462281 [Scenedesmus sp. NREL 46B-D3]